MDAKDRILVALDVSSLAVAAALVRELSPHVGGFKLGKQICTAVGVQAAVEVVQSSGLPAFLDLKFHDIPNTVAAAVREAGKLGVRWVNVHSAGGIDMMLAASGAALESEQGMSVLAVTVLTSIDDHECQIRYHMTRQATVLQLARDARLGRCNGVICSPLELRQLKARPELEGFEYVVPGVRPSWAAANDQKAFTTPAEARKSGANYLVIGRPITNPPAHIGSPADAAQHIAAELA